MTEIKTYNPDVLSCLANLSSDEVFTPPDLANAMLDLLPQSLFSSPDTTFLDPACKTGVFPREIAKRLIKGLETQIPDLRERLDHIFTKQIFALPITELTALLSRRSLYCSKKANGKYSACRAFRNADGNVKFRAGTHDWDSRGHCRFCGANRKAYDRSDDLESHAYCFIHTESPEKIFTMPANLDFRFDVVIGNPPYQLSDGGAFASASPIYHKFIQQAKKLNPRYIAMIVPARWYAGGKGLDDFRDEMLNDRRIVEIHDFEKSEDCFPGIRIAGGVCYFLWTRDTHGDCDFYSHEGSKIRSHRKRPLLEKHAKTLIRINEAIPILRKVQNHKEPTMNTLISPGKPFGLRTDFFKDPGKYSLPKISEKPIPGGFRILGAPITNPKTFYVGRDYPFPNGRERLGKYKVFVSNVLDNGFDWRKERLRPLLGSKDDACTETFLCIGNFEKKAAAENLISYINTKFFHIMLFLKKVSHHVTREVYSFVPVQDFSKPWTDAELYAKYGLTDTEIAFVESMVCPMPASTETHDDETDGGDE